MVTVRCLKYLEMAEIRLLCEEKMEDVWSPDEGDGGGVCQSSSAFFKFMTVSVFKLNECV